MDYPRTRQPESPRIVMQRVPMSIKWPHSPQNVRPTQVQQMAARRAARFGHEVHVDTMITSPAVRRHTSRTGGLLSPGPATSGVMVSHHTCSRFLSALRSDALRACLRCRRRNTQQPHLGGGGRSRNLGPASGRK